MKAKPRRIAKERATENEYGVTFMAENGNKRQWPCLHAYTYLEATLLPRNFSEPTGRRPGQPCGFPPSKNYCCRGNATRTHHDAAAPGHVVYFYWIVKGGIQQEAAVFLLGPGLDT